MAIVLAFFLNWQGHQPSSNSPGKTQPRQDSPITMPIQVSLIVSEFPAVIAVVAAVARLPCVSALNAHHLPPTPTPPPSPSPSSPVDELLAARSRARTLEEQLQDAREEIWALRQRLAAADEALDARELELRGVRGALQGLRDAHVRLIAVIQDAEGKMDTGEP